MWLEMHLGGLFIDRVYLDYSGFETVSERQQYQERIAEELYFKHIRAIKNILEDPEFLVDKVESKMNYDERFIAGSWETLIDNYGSEEAKLRASEMAEELKLNDMGLKIGGQYFKDEEIPQRIYTTDQHAFRATMIKPKKRYLYPKKQVAAPAPVQIKLERHKGGYSNTQWNDVSPEDLDKKG